MRKSLLLLTALSMINMAYTYMSFKRTEREIESLQRIIHESNSVKVTATMYNAVEDQCDKDPLVTAGMYRINPNKASQHRWIAVSRNLLKRWGGKFGYGDKVQITGAGHKDGVYTITDTMNPRFRDRIDFLETKGTKGYKFDNVQLASL
jgi:3D (Asp-Asp-Asp) domain-containing protein